MAETWVQLNLALIIIIIIISIFFVPSGILGESCGCLESSRESLRVIGSPGDTSVIPDDSCGLLM